MTQTASPEIFRWSTDHVPIAQRFAYFEEAVSSALIPMSVSVDPARVFDASFEMGQLGPITVLEMRGAASEARRSARDVARSEAHSYHLLVNRSARWKIEHRTALLLAPGDVVLTNSIYEHWLGYDCRYDVVNLKLTESWLEQWLPHPDRLVGRRIPGDSRWGASLSALLTQLSPNLAVSSPLPGSLIADQVGALLALTAHQFSPPPVPVASPRAQEDLCSRLLALIPQRCDDTMVDATALAANLGVSTRTLHRCLAARGLTLGRELQRARVERALQLLSSPTHRLLTLAEIGRRAGFVDPAHFARVMRAQCGATPSQLRSRI